MSSSSSRNLFEYTSGRFLFNEKLRRSERYVPFDIDALLNAICNAVSRNAGDVASFSKIAEGGFNRILQATFKDGYAVIARIPYRITVPEHYAVASEAATLDLLHSNGIPVPKVLSYAPNRANPVGTEYILMEKLEGVPLSTQWFTMNNKARVKIMKQIVNLEKQFMSIHFPASGSLYYRKDLTQLQHAISLAVQDDQCGPSEIVVGPTAQHEWWYKERARLEINRGPWIDFRSAFEAPAKRELEFCKQFGRSRLHVERYLRQLYEFKEAQPATHIQLLLDFLRLIPHLEVPSDHRFSRPTLRHPDFSPNNILINSSNDISGIIDWQHAVILPLCLCAGIPDYFQNWGDPLSERLAKPEVNMPDNFNQLNKFEQATVQETIRKRLVHFYYAALTMNQMPDHFDALREENLMLRAKLFKRSSAPWEGDSLSLEYAIFQAFTNWPMHVDDMEPASAVTCPVQFSEYEIQRILKDHDREQEIMEELSEMRDLIGIDALGWVPDDEQLGRSKDVVRQIKAGLAEHCNTELERTALQSHFPFDDHDEDS
ncbi:hypothetical protein ARAM_006569 [Aspergillus rambellii]|uniref:Aminoglycoside phosphotransferase domain-containing protein n=1 Tax=Aspergillus rambellii TaxID=308745 RepID=A0A0F8WNG1_9EURO|nr:hypothetical protein ARAM_006569 [Aspergillus rambellii]